MGKKENTPSNTVWGIALVYREGKKKEVASSQK